MKASTALIAIVAALAIGTGVGYYLTPRRVKIVERVVEKRVENRNVVTKTKTTTTPDGTTTTETETTDKTVETADRSSDKSTTIERENKRWLVSAGYGVSLADFADREIIGSLQRRVLGDLYVGVIGTSRGTVALGVSYRF